MRGRERMRGKGTIRRSPRPRRLAHLWTSIVGVSPCNSPSAHGLVRSNDWCVTCHVAGDNQWARLHTHGQGPVIHAPLALVDGAAGRHQCVIAALLLITPTGWRDCQHLPALRDTWWRRAVHGLDMGISAVNQ